MKTRILFIMTLMLAAVTRVMAGSYGFYVGGEEITSSNYQNIVGAIPSDRIKVGSGGSITYVPSTNTLTLKNVTITRTGDSNRGITNDNNEGLKVVFEGEVELDAHDASPILCAKNTTLKCANGGKVTLYTSRSDGLTANGCTITILNADMIITSTTKLGIMSDNNNGKVEIYDSKLKVSGKTGCVGKLNFLYISGASTVTFTGNNSAVTVNNLANFLLDDDMMISYPTGAEYSSTKDAIVTSSSPDGYKGAIKFTTKALQVNSTNFPDDNFRSYISSNVDKNGDGYLTIGERYARKRMDLSYCGIKDLTGIDKLPKLEELDCSHNSLSGNFSLSHNNLKTLKCQYNNITKINTITPQLTYLDCMMNQLEEAPAVLSNLSAELNMNLEYLDCSMNKIQSLDLSGMTKLKTVYCWSSAGTMTSLNVSGCTALTKLHCSSNKLTSLNVSGCTALTKLDCSSNKLTTLNITDCTALEELDCQNNQLTKLSVNSFYLEHIYCYRNKISSFDLSNLSLVSRKGTIWLLYAFDDSDENHIGVSSGTVDAWLNKGWTVKVSYNGTWHDVNDDMIEISSSNFPDAKFQNYLKSQSYGSNSWISYKEMLGITNINVNNKGISSLKGIEKFIKLNILDCGNNSLSTLDISKNTYVTELTCNNNGLSSLDLSKNVAIVYLTCSANNLTSLDLSKCTIIRSLNCDDNKLTSLKVNRSGQVSPLTRVYCQNNKLSASAMQTVLNVAGSEYCYIYVQDRASGNEQNEFNADLLALAKSKKWTPYYKDASGWHKYDENSFVTGIDAATTADETEADADAPRYNLQGQRVGKDYRGVVVVNGRKVWVK